MDISFEFFPPSSKQAETVLWESIKLLEPLNPDFVSVTYGAGGTTRERTHNCVKKIIEETNLEPAAHLTCVNSTKDEIKEITDSYKKIGVKHIVALRGDMPNFVDFEPHPRGYKSSIDLITNLSQQDFNVTVSAYPEKHPDAPSFDEDIEFLKRKIDAGATQAITQFCFDFQIILAYRDLLQKHNIRALPVIGLDNVFLRILHEDDLDFENIKRPEKCFDAAVIMAGGEGMRLRPLTKDMPKPMIDINGSPMIVKAIKSLDLDQAKYFFVIL